MLIRLHSLAYDALRRWEAMQKSYRYQKKPCNEPWLSMLVQLVSQNWG